MCQSHGKLGRATLFTQQHHGSCIQLGLLCWELLAKSNSESIKTASFCMYLCDVHEHSRSSGSICMWMAARQRLIQGVQLAAVCMV